MEPRLKLLDSGGLVGVIRKDLNSPLAVPENRCGRRCSLALFDRCASRPIPREGTRRAAVRACPPRCIRPRRRSGRPPGTLLVPRVQIIVFTERMPPEWAAFFLAGAEGLEPSALGFGESLQGSSRFHGFPVSQGLWRVCPPPPKPF